MIFFSYDYPYFLLEEHFKDREEMNPLIELTRV